MPSGETRAELALRSRGVRIYHVYKYDMMDNGPRTYSFTSDPYGSEDGGLPETFDVRDLPEWQPSAGIDDEKIKDVLRQAIKNGTITQDGAVGMKEEA